MVFHAKKHIFFGFFLVYGLTAAELAPRSCDVLAKDVDLSSSSHVGSKLRVKTIVEVAGSVSVTNRTDSSSITKLPMKVSADLLFDEVGLAGPNSPSVRHYWKAEAKLDVNDVTTKRQLRSDRELILLSSGATNAAQRISSPYGALRREELELMDVAGNLFPAERLLPGRVVDSSEEWTHESQVIAELLRVDEITEGNLSSKIENIDKEHVSIHLHGQIKAKVDGAETSITVKGLYRFDLKSKLVAWLALALKEKREPSFAAPGFDVVARIRSARQALIESELLQSVSSELLKSPGSAAPLEYASSDASYRMLLDARWYLLSEVGTQATLRMVESGELLGSCKVSKLPKSVPGKQITLEGFQSDVQHALGTNCQEILSASESVNGFGVRVLRVHASGSAEETPIEWIYYHLSNDEGERLSYVFTCEAKAANELADAAESVTSSVEFLKGNVRQANQVKRSLESR